ncbi:prephenate dehydratase [Candidatus Gracilibacteria bacterium]|nr:prephenate dehydratase [Candidatus Gracilibacteria bacterium]
MSTKLYYQGVPGAYSHIVANYFQGYITESEVIGVTNFTGVFEAINDSDFGVIPIENSYAGSVYENYFNLAKYDVRIYAEYFLPIHHCLASIGDDIGSIRMIFSHYQAILQTEKYIKSHNWPTENYADTAGSAKYVSTSNEVSYGAICSELAAETYGLNILDTNIQDQEGNTTRFFLVGKEGLFKNEKKVGKISLLFRLNSIPGALHKCLGVFANRDINITKIESIPVKDTPFEYMFWMDIDGQIESASIQKALEELKQFTMQIRILGDY